MTEKRPLDTRQHILDASLGLFRENGFDGTTMRDVAKASKMSLGAAYYYFSSKEALVLVYYEQQMQEHERLVHERLGASKSLRERLGTYFHVRLDILGDDRSFMGGLFRTVADPKSSVSVFAKETKPLRARATQLLEEVLNVPEVPESLRPLAARAAWALLLVILLYFVHDSSPEQQKTRRLTDRTLDLSVTMLPFLALPMAAPMLAEVTDLLRETGVLEEFDD
jgi:AcrR family transcriptional regulator